MHPRPLSAPRPDDEPDPVAVGFVLQLARALHTHGYSAPRLEDVLGATADRLGLAGHRLFSTPTSIMAAFGPEARQRTHLLLMPTAVALAAGLLIAGVVAPEPKLDEGRE
jgi:uncharacterized membrane protein YjjP (DUF1212 family)